MPDLLSPEAERERHISRLEAALSATMNDHAKRRHRRNHYQDVLADEKAACETCRLIAAAFLLGGKEAKDGDGGA